MMIDARNVRALTCFVYVCQFRSALWAHFAHLKEMGAAQMIPSFATIG